MSYSGCHGWAIPKTTADLDGAVEALHLLIGHDAQALDASGGSICAHGAALAAVVPVDDADRARLAITRQTIAEAMITYPALAEFPAIEDAGWSAIHDALEHRISPTEAASRIQAAAQTVLAQGCGSSL